MEYPATEFGESLKLNKKERAELKEAFKRFENSPGFKRKMERGEEICRQLKNSTDPYTRAKYSGKA